MRIDPEPFKTLELPSGVYEIKMSFETVNSWSVPAYAPYEPIGLDVGWWRAFVVGDLGWHSSVLLCDEKGIQLYGNQGQPIGEPWYDYKNKRFQPAYVQYSEKPFGVYGKECWPLPGLTIKTNNSEIYLESTNSPSEMLHVIGHENKIHVWGEQGEQSFMSLDRSALRVTGTKNVSRGDVIAKGGAVFDDGDYNQYVDFTASGLEYLDDSFVFNLKGKSGTVRPHNHSQFIRCKAKGLARRYPVKHMIGGYRADDLYDSARFARCEARNLRYGIVGNGATNARVEGFTAVSCEVPVFLAPHHSTPDVKPKGNRISGVKQL